MSNDKQQRIDILQDTFKYLHVGKTATLEELNNAELHFRHKILSTAMANLKRWSDEASQRDEKKIASNSVTIDVSNEDWGTATQRLTKQTGKMVAALNMANATRPGGGYLDGDGAQEENFFRRTNCHLEVLNELRHGQVIADKQRLRYSSARTKLINGNTLDEAGHPITLLDVAHPRVTFRGPEIREVGANKHIHIKGYAFLPREEYFPFYELRSAAARHHLPIIRYTEEQRADMRRRIQAQINVLISNKVRTVVLSAFGCGAFNNPAHEVAQLYLDEIQQNAEHFDHIQFAIIHPGYGPDNYTPFKEVFSKTPSIAYPVKPPAITELDTQNATDSVESNKTQFKDLLIKNIENYQKIAKSRSTFGRLFKTRQSPERITTCTTLLEQINQKSITYDKMRELVENTAKSVKQDHQKARHIMKFFKWFTSSTLAKTLTSTIKDDDKRVKKITLGSTS